MTGRVDGCERFSPGAGLYRLCCTVLPSAIGQWLVQGVARGVVGWFDEGGPLRWLPAGVAQAANRVESGLEGRVGSGRVLECNVCLYLCFGTHPILPSML